MSEGRKLNPVQKQELLGSLLHLRSAGWTQVEIGEQFGIGRAQVCRYERQLTREFAEAHPEVVSRIKAHRIVDLELAIDEAWEAWFRSVEDGKKTVVRQTGAYPGTDETTEVQCGDTQYLKEIRLCGAELCKLVGAYPVTKIDLSIRMSPEELETARKRYDLKRPGRSLDEMLALSTRQN